MTPPGLSNGTGPGAHSLLAAGARISGMSQWSYHPLSCSLPPGEAGELSGWECGLWVPVPGSTASWLCSPRPTAQPLCFLICKEREQDKNGSDLAGLLPG